jgi:septal ring factor EnvC (AmiA/AmiB activator)
MPETDLEKKVNDIVTGVAVIKEKLDNISLTLLNQNKRIDQLEERVIVLEKQKAEDNGFKKGVNWLIGLIGGGAGAAIAKLLS